MAGTARHILVTGFEPFAGDTANPSQELAKIVDGRVVSDCAVRSLVLPVQHEAAREAVAGALGAPGLAGVVQLGLAGGRARIALEQVAVNVMDYRIPDNQGDVVRDTPCVAGGLPAYFSTLPLRELLVALTAEGIPAYISQTAGTFLCNYALYTTLHALAGRSATIPAGFVHLPYLPATVAAHGLEEPSMDLGVMARALDIILRVVAGA
jgi:pyroglutamyl-peptidase